MQLNILGNNRLKTMALVVLAVVFAFAMQMALAPKAHATTYDLTSTPAPGDCNIYDAINAINTQAVANGCAAGTASNTVNLAAGTYSLALGGSLPPVTFDGDLTINGAGATATIIDGANFQGISFGGTGFTGLSTLNIQNMTLQNFNSNPGSGTVIASFIGNLKADHLLIHDNDCSNAGLPICALFINDGESTTQNVTVTNSAFYSNQAASLIAAGNISSGLNMDIINNTFYNNIASIITVFNAIEATTSTTNFVNNTVANNQFPLTDSGVNGWLAVNTAADAGTQNVNVKNNIFSGNTNNDTKGFLTCTANTSANGHVTTQGGNVVSDNTCAADFTGTNDKNNTDPQLGAFTEVNNTWVMPLLANTPAVDNGITGGLTPSTDQRGVARPQGSAPDSGAYELVVSTPGLPSTGGILASTGFDMKTPAVIAGLLVVAGIGVAGYSLRKR
jgi:hypothetical protein